MATEFQAVVTCDLCGAGYAYEGEGTFRDSDPELPEGWCRVSLSERVVGHFYVDGARHGSEHRPEWKTLKAGVYCSRDHALEAIARRTARKDTVKELLAAVRELHRRATSTESRGPGDYLIDDEDAKTAILGLTNPLIEKYGKWSTP